MRFFLYHNRIAKKNIKKNAHTHSNTSLTHNDEELIVFI